MQEADCDSKLREHPIREHPCVTFNGTAAVAVTQERPRPCRAALLWRLSLRLLLLVVLVRREIDEVRFEGCEPST